MKPWSSERIMVQSILDEYASFIRKAYPSRGQCLHYLNYQLPKYLRGARPNDHRERTFINKIRLLIDNDYDFQKLPEKLTKILAKYYPVQPQNIELEVLVADLIAVLKVGGKKYAEVMGDELQTQLYFSKIREYWGLQGEPTGPVFRLIIEIRKILKPGDNGLTSLINLIAEQGNGKKRKHKSAKKSQKQLQEKKLASESRAKQGVQNDKVVQEVETPTTAELATLAELEAWIDEDISDAETVYVELFAESVSRITFDKLVLKKKRSLIASASSEVKAAFKLGVSNTERELSYESMKSDLDKLGFEFPGSSDLRSVSDAYLSLVEYRLDVVAQDLTDTYHKIQSDYYPEDQFRDLLNKLKDEAKCDLNSRVSQTIEALRLKIRDKALKFIHRNISSHYKKLVESYYSSNLADYVPKDEFESIRKDHVYDWFKRKQTLLPTDEQLSVIVSDEDSTLVIARAGSGKTSTLVNKVYYLCTFWGVDPREILFLTFNRDAIADVKARFKKEADKPAMSTFHALAYGLIKDESKALDEADFDRRISRIFLELNESQRFAAKVRRLMKSHYSINWNEVIEAAISKASSSEEDITIENQFISLRGEFLKSWGEKVIADYLFTNGICYYYEKPVMFDDAGGMMRPDFTIPTQKENSSKSGIIVEYFGMAGEPVYDRISKRKKDYWAGQSNWVFLEFYPPDIAEDGGAIVKDRIAEALAELNFVYEELDDEVVWEEIKGRAEKEFLEISKQFIKRARKVYFSRNELDNAMGTYKTTFPAEESFLELQTELFGAYLKDLELSEKLDFDGLIVSAADLIERGSAEYCKEGESYRIADFKYIFIDEYQDFSRPFFQLITSITKVNPKVKFTCVGDDWQAINGFAGADLKYFQRFEMHFKNSKTLHLKANFRSQPRIVELGNLLMKGNGQEAFAAKKTKGLLGRVDYNNFETSYPERVLFQGDHTAAVLLRVINRCLQDSKSIHILYRTDKGPVRRVLKDLETLKGVLPYSDRNKITNSTIHSFKGKEADSIILVDFEKPRYPFVHPNSMYNHFFEPTSKLLKEEERLFYVALSRARLNLILVGNKETNPFFAGRISDNLSFLDHEKFPEAAFSLDELPILVSIENLRSGATFKVKDKLKRDGYMWNKYNRTWWRTFNRNEFSIDLNIKVKEWSETPGLLITVEGLELKPTRFETPLSMFFKC